MNLAYDFDYQQMTPFGDNEIEILPGDELIVECVYDSTERDTITYGGEGTYDEMCLSFLLVYPKPKLAMCITSYLGWYEYHLFYILNYNEYHVLNTIQVRW